MADDEKNNKNKFGVEMVNKKSKTGKTLNPNSIYDHLDVNGDGIITDEEMSRAKELAEIEHTLKMHDNDDKKEDQIRAMAWFALWGMLLYPLLILVTSIMHQEQASQLISDIAAPYFVAIAGLVAAFFGAQAYSKGKTDTPKK